MRSPINAIEYFFGIRLTWFQKLIILYNHWKCRNDKKYNKLVKVLFNIN
jgi:hypothetical protein